MVKTVEFWFGHPLSYTTTNIDIFYNDIELSSASGFVMQYGQEYALVTNLHVLSGKNPINGNVLASTGAIPNRISFHVALSTIEKTQKGEVETLHFRPCEVDLFRDGKPVWIDSKESNNQNDFCIIKLADFIGELKQEGASIRAVQGGKVTLKKGRELQSGIVRPEDVSHFYPTIGSDVYILGYPRGITHSGVFPIWKKASIASEPLTTVMSGGVAHSEIVYVDSLTRHGMSGSPVIRLPTIGETFQTEDGVVVEATDPTPLLLGVYAGRDGVTSEEYELALGRVWKAYAIENLFHKPFQLDSTALHLKRH